MLDDSAKNSASPILFSTFDCNSNTATQPYKWGSGSSIEVDPTQLNISNDQSTTMNKSTSFQDNLFTALKKLKISYPKKIIIGHLNINSIKNKIDELRELIKDVDIFVVSETKLDSSFPNAQFHIHGFREPFRKDRSNRGNHGGGLIVYTRNDIPCKLISFPSAYEILCIEINIRKVKWFLIGCYYPRPNPSNLNDQNFLAEVGKAIDFKNYQNIMVIGDINLVPTNENLVEFMTAYNLKNLIKDPTCYKSVENPTLIDVILTNKPKSFQKSATFTSGISDFHQMVITMLKTEFTKLNPNVIKYRCYKRFDKVIFNNDLKINLDETNNGRITNYCTFQTALKLTLDKHAPQKTCTVRANNAPFLNKTLRKAIMNRSRFKNKYLKDPSITNLNTYRRQRNVCLSMLRKSKRVYFDSLNISNINDNKKFWKSIKPYCSEKCNIKSKIILIENNEIISDDETIAEVMNNYFVNITKHLDIPQKGDNQDKMGVDGAIKSFEYHPSVISIKNNVTYTSLFNFSLVGENQVKQEILKLNPSKATGCDYIPAKILKICCNTITSYLTNIFNYNILVSKEFPNELKLAEIFPIFKKDEIHLKENYRAISILPAISKIFERLLDTQIMEYMNSKLSPLLCGFRKGYNTQHPIIRLIEKLRSALDKGETGAVLLMDLSKAYDCLDHCLFIAKLKAYGFSNASLEVIFSYLSNREQRVKMGNSFSTWKMIKLGVPQGSVLGPIFFNIFINDIFFFINEDNITNYADDNGIFSCNKDMEIVMNQITKDCKILNNWFTSNFLLANTKKYNICSFGNSEFCSLKIGDQFIQESSNNNENRKLLGIILDKKLNFDDQIEYLCKKATSKLQAVKRISNFLTRDKLKLIINSFVLSHFYYCPLVWMNCSRLSNAKINRIHERTLRLIYRDYTSEFKQLLLEDKSVTFHQKNRQTLAIEIFKTKNGLNPSFMKQVFKSNNINNYNLRSEQHLILPRTKTVTYGLGSLKYMGYKTWNNVPITIRKLETMGQFKLEIKKWNEDNCDCKLCKNYVQNLGYI